MSGELSRIKTALDEWIAVEPELRRSITLFRATDISSILGRADQLKAEEEHSARVKDVEDFAR